VLFTVFGIIVIFKREASHVLDLVLFHEDGSGGDNEEHTKGEPKGDERDVSRPVVVDDAFEHDVEN
jgi:hypothetical protein